MFNWLFRLWMIIPLFLFLLVLVLMATWFIWIPTTIIGILMFFITKPEFHWVGYAVLIGEAVVILLITFSKMANFPNG